MADVEHVDSMVSAARRHPLSVKVEALRLLSTGKTPGEVCKDLNVPRGTLAWWRQASPEYRRAYAHAIRAGADHLAAETVEIADAVEADRDQVNRARVRIAARQWLAGKYAPDVYGDRVQHDVQAEVVVRRTRFRSLLGERRVIEVEPGAGDAEPNASTDA